MGIIGNIYVSHHIEKAHAFKDIVSKQNYDGCMILGAQYENDTTFLYSHFKEDDKPIILVDMRKSELLKFKDPTEKVKLLDYDISYSYNEDKCIEELQASGCSNPLVYDNLSGSEQRFGMTEKVLKSYDFETMYIHKRGGTCGKVLDRFSVYSEHDISQHNCLMVISSKPENKRITKDNTRLFNRMNQIKYAEVSGKQCPICDARPPWISYRLTRLPHFRCSRCSHEWNS